MAETVAGAGVAHRDGDRDGDDSVMDVKENTIT